MEYVTQCKDNKTGLTLVLSEVSYNVALDWLQRKAEKYFRQIFRCEKVGELMEISVGKPKVGADYNGWETKWYADIIKFYYDEDRGLLLEE